MKERISNFEHSLTIECGNISEYISNPVFNEIAEAKSVGHYQYHKFGEFFTYREQMNIHELKKITITEFINKLEFAITKVMKLRGLRAEKNGNKYSIFFDTAEGTYQYIETSANLLELLVQFYEYGKVREQTKKAS